MNETFGFRFRGSNSKHRFGHLIRNKIQDAFRLAGLSYLKLFIDSLSEMYHCHTD